MPTPIPTITAQGITKTFGPLRAVDEVSLTVHPGSVHAIVGENGAGKSTLVKCMLGFYHPDSGSVNVGEVTAAIHTPADARRHGMGMVFQHFTLIPSMTVAANLVLSRPDLPSLISWPRENAAIAQFLETAPFQLDPASRVQDLAAGQKQKLEILKQLYLGTRILILDEPTSVLTPSEASHVLGVLRQMARDQRISVVIITHKLREVTEYADEVTVLRRGRHIATSPVKDVTLERIADWMVGDVRPEPDYPKSPNPPGPPTLHLSGLSVNSDQGLPAVRNLNLTVRKGEILGIAGVSGNGQRELIQAIGGQRPVEGGEILIDGKTFVPSRQAIRATGLFTLPEEPLDNATVPSMSVAENLALRTFDRDPWLHPSRLRDAALQAIRAFSIRTPSPDSPIRNLSGGNVQRAVLARELASGEVRILAVANPCFGLDLGATAFVHNHLTELRNRGGAILLVSEDLDELLALSDRIAVMSAGRIVYETTREAVDMTTIGSHMGGH